MNNIEPFYLEVGRRVREFRDKRGLTQEALGKQLNPPVTRASIANIETGMQRVLAHTLVQLANSLHVEVIQLIPANQAKQKSSMNNVESELALKLQLPSKEIKRITAKLKTPDQRKKP